MKQLLLFISTFIWMAGSAFGQSDSASVLSSGPAVAMISVEGAISPTTTNYILRGIQKAKEQQAEALIVQLDTPGGLLESTKNIVQEFLQSGQLPIVVYGGPEGPRAASAGNIITRAAHIEGMGPGTTIGAASPVQMGGGQTDS